MGLQSQIKSDGSMELFKAWLVAKGFSLQAGIDYHGTFSPVMKMGMVTLVFYP